MYFSSFRIKTGVPHQLGRFSRLCFGNPVPYLIVLPSWTCCFWDHHCLPTSRRQKRELENHALGVFYEQSQMWHTPLFFTVYGHLLHQTTRKPGNEEKMTLPLTHLIFLARKYPLLPCPLPQTKHSPKSRISSCWVKLLIKSRGDLPTLLPVRWLIRPWTVHCLLIFYPHTGVHLQTADPCLSSSLRCGTFFTKGRW